MATIATGSSEPVAPTDADTQLAREASLGLARLLAAQPRQSLRVRVEADELDDAIPIPLSAIRLLKDILTQMALGNAVALIPVHAELTTQQAADLLNVSRPFLIEQLEKRIIPHRKVGTHRRVLYKDVIEYKQTMLQKRLQALEELSALDQQLGLGY